MSLRINQTVPDFDAETTEGPIRFHDWIGDDWAILFSHPKDFTPVCTTEFGAVAQLDAEWKKRGVKVIGISVDGVAAPANWEHGRDVVIPATVSDEDAKAKFGEFTTHFPYLRMTKDPS
jgi:alkyl hydroperoxide reductase subunit AhpC